MTALEEAADACARASAVVKKLVERAATLTPEQPRSEDDEQFLRAAVKLALANMHVCNLIFDEVQERAGNA